MASSISLANIAMSVRCSVGQCDQTKRYESQTKFDRIADECERMPHEFYQNTRINMVALRAFFHWFLLHFACINWENINTIRYGCSAVQTVLNFFIFHRFILFAPFDCSSNSARHRCVSLHKYLLGFAMQIEFNIGEHFSHSAGIGVWVWAYRSNNAHKIKIGWTKIKCSNGIEQ